MKVQRIAALLTSHLTRQLALVLSGNIFSAGLGFLAIMLISRELSVSDFGLFNIARSVIVVGSLFAGLGMDTGMIRFASSYLGAGKPAEASQVFRTTLAVTIITGLVIAAVIYYSADFVSAKILKHFDLIPLMKLASIGILGAAALNYLRSVFYTYQSFRRSVILQILVDFIKFSAIGALILFPGIDSFAAVAVFTFAPLFGVLLGFGQLRHNLFSERKAIKNLSSSLFSYSKWLFVSNICQLTVPYAGILMLTTMINSKAAGIYGLAVNLVYIFPIIIGSLKSVLLPEVSRFQQIRKFEKYAKGSLKISFCLWILIIPFFFLSNKLILFFFGPRYLESVPIFNLLLLSSITQVINSTVRVALYSFNKPQVIAVTDVIRLSVLCLGCYFLIPSLGIIAPAIVVLILNVGILGFLLLYVFKEIRRNSLTFQEEVITEPFSSL